MVEAVPLAEPNTQDDLPMAKDKQPQRPKPDPLADEIDALLKKLPHADPGLKGTEPRRPAPVPGSTGPRPAVHPAGQGGPLPTDGSDRWAVWGRVALGALFAIALSQWPYTTRCGWPLYGYTAVVLLMFVVGGWCTLASWRHYMGGAHLVSLGLVFWGIVLGAEVLLPRIGYSVDSETWRCPPPATTQPAPPSATPPALTPVAPDPAAASEVGEVGVPDTATSPDSLEQPDTAAVSLVGGTPPDSVPD